jgi:hypothetical protein
MLQRLMSSSQVELPNAAKAELRGNSAAGAKALVLLALFSARLKSCPDTKHFAKLARNRLTRTLVLQSSIKPSTAKRDAARLKPCPSSRVCPQHVKPRSAVPPVPTAGRGRLNQVFPPTPGTVEIRATAWKGGDGRRSGRPQIQLHGAGLPPQNQAAGKG